MEILHDKGGHSPLLPTPGSASAPPVDDSLLDATGPESGDREKMLDEPTWPTDNLTNTGHDRPSKFQLSGSIFRKFLYKFLELFIHKSNF